MFNVQPQSNLNRRAVRQLRQTHLVLERRNRLHTFTQIHGEHLGRHSILGGIRRPCGLLLDREYEHSLGRQQTPVSRERREN
jgi:hypothetical protein